jgi:hypothetical protein
MRTAAAERYGMAFAAVIKRGLDALGVQLTFIGLRDAAWGGLQVCVEGEADWGDLRPRDRAGILGA